MKKYALSIALLTFLEFCREDAGR